MYQILCVWRRRIHIWIQNINLIIFMCCVWRGNLLWSTFNRWHCDVDLCVQSSRAWIEFWAM